MVLTEDGSAAKAVAKYRPPCPVVVASPNEAVLRQLGVVFGIYPCKVRGLHSRSPCCNQEPPNGCSVALLTDIFWQPLSLLLHLAVFVWVYGTFLHVLLDQSQQESQSFGASQDSVLVVQHKNPFQQALSSIIAMAYGDL